MDLNSIVFPIHHLEQNMNLKIDIDTQEVQDAIKEMIYIPRPNHSSSIPCLLLTHIRSKKFMLYLHGNGENIIMCYNQLHEIRQRLKINILAMEYPQYEATYLKKG